MLNCMSDIGIKQPLPAGSGCLCQIIVSKDAISLQMYPIKYDSLYDSLVFLQTKSGLVRLICSNLKLIGWTVHISGHGMQQ